MHQLSGEVRSGQTEGFSCMTNQVLQVSNYFRKFYSGKEIAVPSISQREFGVGFDKKINYRHKAFSTQREFQHFLTSEGPLFVSYSVAMFEFPWAQPMQKKSMLSADLVFDIDSKPEEEGHNPVFCHGCIENSKQATQKLLDNFIFADFGLSKGDVQIVFSGSKGFHVHIRSPVVQQLSGNARRILADYITGRSLSMESFVKQRKIGQRISILSGPDKNSGGWGGYFYSVVNKEISTGDLTALRALGLTSKRAQYIIDNRAKVLQLMENGNWDVFHSSVPAVQQIFNNAFAARTVEVDSPVTFDVHRLIRVPGTLHGDTALIAKPLTYVELEKFSPTKDAVGFPQTQVSCEVKENCSFEYGGKTFELKIGKAALPLPVALLMACKGKAELW